MRLGLPRALTLRDPGVLTKAQRRGPGDDRAQMVPIRVPDPSNFGIGQAIVPDRVLSAMQAAGMTRGGAFTPGEPIRQEFPWGTPPRQWDFPTGYNIAIRPRSAEGRPSYSQLTNVVTSYDVARMCIEHRVDDVRSLDWRLAAQPGVTADVKDEIDQAAEILRKPDMETPIDQWIAAFADDVLSYESGAVYRMRTYGGDVVGLALIDGRTLAPLVDWYGRSPAAPAPAYVQFVQGVPAEWVSRDDLIYEPFRPQTHSPYGMPPIEEILLLANTDINFQLFFLEYFTRGTVPQGFMEAPADFSSPESLQTFQEKWGGAHEGDVGQKHQIIWVPQGAKYVAAKPTVFTQEFPLYLLRRCCAAYKVTPNDMGFTDAVNKSSSDTQVDVQFRIGTRPFIRYLEGILTRYLQDDRHLRVQFNFDLGLESEDRLQVAQAHQIYIQMGVISPDEVRISELGLPVDVTNPVGRMVYTSRHGFIPLAPIMAAQGEIDPSTKAPVPGAAPVDPQALAVLDNSAGAIGQIAAAQDVSAQPGISVATGLQGHDLDGQEPGDAPTDAGGTTMCCNGLTAAQHRHASADGRCCTDDPPSTDPDDVPDDLLPRTDLADASVRQPDRVAKGPDIDPDLQARLLAQDREWRQWRSVVQKRLRAGRPIGRPFAAAAIPAGIVASVQAALGDCQTWEDAAAVFNLAKRAALTTSPKGAAPGGAGPGQAAEPWAVTTGDAVAAAYGPLIQQVLNGGRSGSQLVAWARATAANGSGAAVAATVASLGLDGAALLALLTGLWAQAWLLGLAAQASAHPDAPRDPADQAALAMAWDRFTPGMGLPVPVDVPGLPAFTAERADAIDGIDRTTLDRLTTALRDGIARGEPDDTLANAVEAILRDPTRSALIARTEVARAMGAASVRWGTATGAAQKRWDVLPGACALCDGNADDGWIATGTPFRSGDQAPGAHPLCRCWLSLRGTDA